MDVEHSVPKRRNITFRRRGITQKKAYNSKEEFFTLQYIRKGYTLVMKSEEADFQFLNIAVALNSLIYFHSYVLYFRYIVWLLSCISDCIGVLTC